MFIGLLDKLFLLSSLLLCIDAIVMISFIIEWIQAHPGLSLFMVVMLYRFYQNWAYTEPVVEGSRVTQVNTVEQFKEEVEVRKLVLVNFTADWCPGCRTAAPQFATLSRDIPKVGFVKINVDTSPDLSKGINSIPTFKLYKEGKEFASFVGFNKVEILEKIKEVIGEEKS